MFVISTCNFIMFHSFIFILSIFIRIACIDLKNNLAERVYDLTERIVKANGEIVVIITNGIKKINELQKEDRRELGGL